MIEGSNAAEPMIVDLSQRVISVTQDPQPDVEQRRQLRLSAEMVNRLVSLLHQIPLGRGLHHEHVAANFPGYGYSELVRIVGLSGVLLSAKTTASGLTCNPDIEVLIIEPDGSHEVVWSLASEGLVATPINPVKELEVMPAEPTGLNSSAETLQRLAPDIALHLAAMAANWAAGFEALTGMLVAHGVDLASGSFGAISNHGSWNFVQVLDREASLDDSDSNVALIEADGAMCVDRWNTVREQAGLILGKGSHFVGDIWTEWIDNESLPPLHLDADEWTGSVESYDGDTEFVMKYNGDEFSFRPMEHPFWGVGDPGVRPGMWLSVESEYTGISVNSDPSGCLWADAIEWATMFLGRPPAETGDEALGVFELLDRPEANGEFTIELITSEFLAPGQMAEMVRLLADKDPNFDPEAVAVSCPEFAGTAEELLTHEPQT